MIPVAVCALKEAVRKRTFLILGLVMLAYLIFWAVMLYYFNRSGIAGRSAPQFKSLAAVMLTQMCLQFSSMLVSLLTIMISAGSVASEIESGMIHAILSRPLGRVEYLAGKFLGMFMLLFLYSTLFFAAILMIGGAYSLETVTALTAARIIKGWALYLLVPAAVLCLTMYGSVSLRAVPNGLLMIFIYILGNIGGMVEMIGNFINSRSVISSGIFISLISPFHTLYGAAERVLFPMSGLAGELMRGAGGLTGGGRPASAAMYIYIAVYSAAFLTLAALKLRKMDIN